MRRKIKSLAGIKSLVLKLKRQRKKVVFTNGCFDLLHLGHIRYLQRARRAGDFLIVGLNSDRSLRKIKGKGRPVIPERDRAEILAALEFVDAVVIFPEPTPIRLIEAIQPDVLIKGADWPREQIVGAERVRKWGGKVVRISLTPGRSTSKIINKISNLGK